MQLDLFQDNTPGILLNMADEFVRAREFGQAVSVYEQLCADYPEERSAAPLLKQAGEWRGLLAGIGDNSGNQAYLHSIWLRHGAISCSTLRLTVLGILIDELRSLSQAEHVYISPDFHLGHVLMAAGNYAEAADCFCAALSGNAVERGRLLAWRGDALTLAGNDDVALRSYLTAFLDDPFTVDMQAVKNPLIVCLSTSLHTELDDEIEVNEEPAWLPVWGWLDGVFALPPQLAPDQAVPGTSEFEALLAQNNCTLPRIWFDMLTRAERLRTVSRDDRELTAVRRLMKKTNGFMFDHYMEKIAGRR